MKRRKALLLLAGLGVSSAGALWVGRRLLRFRPDWWKRWRWDGRSAPTLPDEPPGPLSSEVLTTLAALPPAMFGPIRDVGHYRRVFAHRAEGRPGYRWLYEDFVRRLDSRARQESGGVGFSALPREVQRRVLLAMGVPTQRPRGADLERLSLQTARFERFITREIVHLFDATDAWLFAGYPKWPGMPRGLAYYQQPVAR